MSKKSNTLCGMDDDWQAQSDMRTLAESEEIRKDPKRLAKAKAAAQKKLDELRAVATTTATPAP